MGGCIVYTEIMLLLLIYLSFFNFSFQFSKKFKFFVTLFSGTVRPRKLKLGTHVDSGQMYRVYRNQDAAAYSSLFSSIFYLSNFQTLKIFVALFSETVRPIKLNLTHTWTMGGCIIYTAIRLLMLLICPLLYHFSFSPVFKNFTVSSHFSQELLGLENFNGTLFDYGYMYQVYKNQAAASYLFLYFFIFLSVQL